MNENQSLDNPSEAPVEAIIPIGVPEEAAMASSMPTRKISIWKIIAIAGLAIIAIGVAGYFAYANFFGSKVTTDDTQTVKRSLMGAELTVADGDVQLSSDNKTWTTAKADIQIKEGQYISTKATGRVVIALDDGSAVRINNNSIVKIDSLELKNIVITNISGEVYSRLVVSDRKFSVKIGDETYVAMGTAYKSINTAECKGVEVYESRVKLTVASVEVPEGKFYCTDAATAGLGKTLTDISATKLKADTFVGWNYSLDKQNADFKQKLGYLTNYDEPVATPVPAATAVPTTASVASITLSGVKTTTGVKLTWKLNNVTSAKGFKVAKSAAINPTYGKEGTSANYVSDPAARSYSWQYTGGGTYHFRVCIYSGESCTTYSNDISLTFPKVEETVKTPTGTLVLTNTSGNNFSWVLSGSAPYGYKLVWSTETAPVYPGNDYSFYSSGSILSGSINPAVPGTYYVRVCMYNNGSCLNYSNQVTKIVE